MDISTLNFQINALLPFEPLEDQALLIGKLATFIADPDSDSIFILRGYAGTGKTSVVGAMVKALTKLEIKTKLIAPTGRAAKVLSGMSGKGALTIHKEIYRQKSSSDGFGNFELNFNANSKTIFVVDEASMISNSYNANSTFGSGYLLEDLIKYVYNDKGCKLIFVGDNAQLPPVGSEESPALSTREMECYGKDVMEHDLTEVVRQGSESGIIYNATNIRNEGSIEFRTPGYLKIETKPFEDIERITGADLIEELTNSFDKYGEDETIVITRSNKRANKFNEGIRGSILYKESQLCRGDRVMVVKNNYHWVADISQMDFIANGDIAEVVSIGRHEELYGFNFANVTLRFTDSHATEVECKVIINTLTSETPSLSREDNIKLFNSVSADYADIRNKQERWKKIKANPYFNAIQIKFAYAITCHKAQGGEWKSVFIDQGYVTEEMLDTDFLRWLYTAITRPTEKLYLVNFNKDFFEDDES